MARSTDIRRKSRSIGSAAKKEREIRPTAGRADWYLAGGHYHYCARHRTLEACDGSDCNGHCRRKDV